MRILSPFSSRLLSTSRSAVSKSLFSTAHVKFFGSCRVESSVSRCFALFVFSSTKTKTSSEVSFARWSLATSMAIRGDPASPPL